MFGMRMAVGRSGRSGKPGFLELRGLVSKTESWRLCLILIESWKLRASILEAVFEALKLNVED